MRITDPTAYARAHARARSEFSGSIRGPFEAAHVWHRGFSGIGITCDLVLVLLTRAEHRAHHAGHAPTQKDLIAIVAGRYGVTSDEVEREFYRIRRLAKGSCPNMDKPAWVGEYPVASDRGRRLRGAGVKGRPQRVLTNKAQRRNKPGRLALLWAAKVRLRERDNEKRTKL